MSVNADLAAWLKADALYATADGASAALFGPTAKDSTVISPLALKDDAQAEAASQAAFLSGPLASDIVAVKGYRSDLLGKPIVVQGDRLGYEGAGSACFVVAVEEVAGGTTNLTVIRRL